MKRLVLLFIFAIPAMAQTPTYANNGAGCPINTVKGGPTDSVTSYNCPLPNATGAGNLLVIWLRYNNANSPTVSFTHDSPPVALSTSIAKTVTDTTTTSTIYYVPNVAAGMKLITVNFSASASFVQMQPYEFYNVAQTTPLEATSGTTSTGATIAAGSLSSTVTSGDLIVEFGFMDNMTQNGTAVTSCSPASQTNISWVMRSAMVSATPASNFNQEPMCFQYGIYNNTPAFNPTFTFAPGGSVSGNYVALSAAFKAAAAGTPPPNGIRVNYIQHDDGGNINSTTATLDLPSSGNLMVEVFTGGCSTTASTSCSFASAFSDSQSSWTQIGTTQVYCLGGAACTQAVVGQIWYTSNPVAGLHPVTLTTNNEGLVANFPNSWMMFDIGGASSNPLDLTFGGNGNGLATMGASAANWSSGTSYSTFGGSSPVTPAVTPSKPNELIISAIGAESGTFTGTTSPAGAQFISSWYVNESNYSWNDLNGGWAIFYPGNSTAAETWTWTFASLGSPSQTSPGRGLGIAAAFAPPTAVTPAVIIRTPGWHKINATALCGGPENAIYEDPDNFPQNINASFASYGMTFTTQCQNGFRDSNGAMMDTTRHRMILMGGGHVGYRGNDIWSLELSLIGTGTTNNFGVVSPMYHLDHTANGNFGTGGGAVNGPACPASGPIGATVIEANGASCTFLGPASSSPGTLGSINAEGVCGYTAGCFPTGATIGSNHNYEQMSYIPLQDELAQIGIAGTVPQGNGNDNTWLLPMSSVVPSCAPTLPPNNTNVQGCNPLWQNIGNVANFSFGNVAVVTVYDPNTQGVWSQTTGGLFFFNPATNVITRKSTNPNGSHFSGVFDPIHNYFIFAGFQSEGGIRYINIGAGGTFPFINPTTTNCSGVTGAPNQQYPGMVWDPIDRRVVIYPNTSATLYILDPVTWTCTSESYGSIQFPAAGADYPQDTPITTGQQGTFGHFGYDPGFDVFALCNDPANDCWYLRRRRGNAKIQ
jgi:hypothetical protein